MLTKYSRYTVIHYINVNIITMYLILTRPSFAICSTSEEVFCLFESLAGAPSEGYNIDKTNNNITLLTRLAVNTTISYFALLASASFNLPTGKYNVVELIN